MDFILCLGKFSCANAGSNVAATCHVGVRVCVCVLTSVNDEAYGVLAQSVIKGNHNHGVGVAGQL